MTTPLKHARRIVRLMNVTFSDAEVEVAAAYLAPHLERLLAAALTEITRLRDICDHQRHTLYFIEGSEDGAELHASDARFEEMLQLKEELARAAPALALEEAVLASPFLAPWLRQDLRLLTDAERRDLGALQTAVRTCRAARDARGKPVAAREQVAILREMGADPSLVATLEKGIGKRVCQCTHEQGDSECPVHPTCGDCGAPLPCPEHGPPVRGWVPA